MSPEDVQIIGEIVRRGIASALSDVLTCTVCEVVTFDAATETADLRPMIRRPVPATDETIVHEELPVLPNVLVCFPQGAGRSISWDLVPSDVVLFVASAYSIGAWRLSGELSDAGDIRQHHPASGFCLPFMSRERPSLGLGAVKVGSRDASEPATLGAKNAAWLDAILDALIAAGFPATPPDLMTNATPAATLSASVMVGD